MKYATRLTAKFAFPLLGLVLFASSALAGDQDGPSPDGLCLYVQLDGYYPLRPVKFKIRKNSSPSDHAPANLRDSYYIIERRVDNQGVEFYTSRREPFGKSLSVDTSRVWSWNQWDNENEHSAPHGQWRLKFYTPHVSAKPLIVHFKISG